MLEDQLEVEMRKAFADMERTVERTGLGLHDHLDHMEGGQLSKVMTAILDMTERVRKMELAIQHCQSEISELGVDIADLQTRIEMATHGR